MSQFLYLYNEDMIAPLGRLHFNFMRMAGSDERERGGNERAMCPVYRSEAGSKNRSSINTCGINKNMTLTNRILSWYHGSEVEYCLTLNVENIHFNSENNIGRKLSAALNWTANTWFF